MSRLVEFPLQSGGSLIIETDAPEPSGPRPAGTGGIERATQDLDQAVGKVRPLAEALFAELQELSTKPSEVAVEFGIKLSAEAGVIIAKTAVEGNCRITLKWT
jgi:hypothetical protein